MSNAASRRSLHVAMAAAMLAWILHLTSVVLLLALPSPGHPPEGLGIPPYQYAQAWAVMENDGTTSVVGERQICAIRLPSPVALGGCVELPAPVQAPPVASPDSLLVAFGDPSVRADGQRRDPEIGYALVARGRPPRIERLTTGGLEERPLHTSWQAIHRPDRFEIHRWECHSGLHLRIALDGTPGAWEPFDYEEDPSGCLVGFEPGDPSTPIAPASLEESRRRAIPWSARKILRLRYATEEDGWSVERRGMYQVLVGRAPDGRRVPVARLTRYGADVLTADRHRVLVVNEGRVVVLDEALREAWPVHAWDRGRMLLAVHAAAHPLASLAYMALLLFEPAGLVIGLIALRREPRARFASFAIAASLIVLAVAALAVILLPSAATLPW